MHQTLNRVRGISLGEVLPEGRILGADDIRVTSCCSDSRRCRPGDLFVAQIGSEHDGHDFARDAIRRGAVAILAERQLPANVPTCLVNDTRDAFGRVCQALAGNPSRQLRVVGITGTSGKTVTSVLVTAVLEAAGHDVGIMGSLGYCDLVETAPARMTTPTPPELASWMARMQANGCSHAVVEVSSISLAQCRTAGVEFDAACLTNVRRDHLDFHGSVLNYHNAKAKLLRQLRPQGFAVINTDDPASKIILSKLENPVLTVGMQHSAELTASVIERHKSEQTFLLSAGSEMIPVRTHIIGDHHVYNCLTAAAVGLVYGIDLPTVARGLESVTFVPGRMERIECGQPYGVYVDNAHTPDALSVVLNTLRQVTNGRLICVFGAEGDRDRRKRPLMGRVVERCADVGIITSNNPRTEPPLSIIHDVLDGYDRPSRGHILPDRTKAICLALSEARAGDTVLIAGKGDQDHQIIGNDRNYFDDRQLVRTWLYQSAGTADEARANT